MFIKFFYGIFCFLFYLACKMFSRVCCLTRKSDEKECVLQSD